MRNTREKLLTRMKGRVDRSIEMLQKGKEATAKETGVAIESADDYIKARVIAALEEVAENLADMLEDEREAGAAVEQESLPFTATAEKEG